MSDRFVAYILRGHQVMLSHFVGRLQQGTLVTPTAQELTDLGDLAGNLNSAAGVVPPPPPPAQNNTIAMHDVIPFGDYNRRYFPAEKGVVDVFPLYVPGPPYGAKGPLVYMSVSENDGAPLLRIATISRTPGDLNGVSAINWGRGKEVLLSFIAGVDARPGELLYFNTMRDEDPEDQDTSTRSGFSIVW